MSKKLCLISFVFFNNPAAIIGTKVNATRRLAASVNAIVSAISTNNCLVIPSVKIIGAKLIHQKDMGKSADPINLIEGVTDLTRENYCEKIFGRTNPTDICTVGTGIMDIPEIVKTVTELDYAPYIIVELDCCARQTEEEYNTPLSPLASIKASREYLESVIG